MHYKYLSPVRCEAVGIVTSNDHTEGGAEQKGIAQGFRTGGSSGGQTWVAMLLLGAR